jgi:NhaA family Na+:H+ antiporter
MQMVKPKGPRRVVGRLHRAFREFARLEAAGGLVLLGAALIALVWANSPWASLYEDLWHISVSVGFGTLSLTQDLHWWINEALMVVFFFVVGLEIKREILVGELSSVGKGTLPVLAAVGGMLVMGARGQGTWSGTALGSVSMAVVLRSPCPVLVVR